MNALPVSFLVVFATIFGLVIGSFLNVVIYRVPAKRTLMGRSECPRCDHQIRGWDNVPVLSWLILRAKCRDCHAPISARYPLVEAATGLAWAGLAAWQGWSPILPLLLILASFSIALAMIDFDTMTLPNALTYPVFILTAVYLTVLAIMTGTTSHLATAAIGAVIYGGFFFLMYVLTRGRGLGFGDVKLAPTLGALIGWFSISGTFVGLFAAFVVGGIPAGILMSTGVIKRGSAIPFGPMLIAGAWIGAIWGADVWNWYLALSGMH